MNRQPALQKSTINEVASLLIPVVDRVLLVPTVTVAEMVPYTEPRRDPEAPDWFLGTINWREIQVPILCFEVLNGGQMPEYNNKCRVAIMNNAGVDESLPFLGIATQGIPRLSRVKPDEIHELAEMSTKRFEMMVVSLAGETVAIPDVVALEQAYLDYRR